MRSVTVFAAITSALALAACGGGSKPSAPNAPAQNPSGDGGVVAAQPSKGLLGPATSVTPSGAKTVGRTVPLRPHANAPGKNNQSGVGSGVACSSVSANPAPSNISVLSSAILCLLNAQRANAGLPPLQSNASLAKAAHGWAGRMVAQRFFAHESGGSSPLTRIRKTGYVHGTWQIGENIAWGSGILATPGQIVDGWMHSPGHRANILHGAFRDIGIGIKLGAPGAGLSGGAVYVTDFGKHT